jgi:hypothetical protein
VAQSNGRPLGNLRHTSSIAVYTLATMTTTVPLLVASVCQLSALLTPLVQQGRKQLNFKGCSVLVTRDAALKGQLDLWSGRS